MKHATIFGMKSIWVRDSLLQQHHETFGSEDAEACAQPGTSGRQNPRPNPRPRWEVMY
jgi:hypothetical protein